MRCKECREKIPDNVKYCPECGALINENVTYNYGRYTQQSKSQPEPSYHEEDETPRTFSFPKPDVRVRKPKLFAVILIAFAVIYAITILSQILSFNNSDIIFEEIFPVEDAEEVIINDDYDADTSAAGTVFDYLSNITDCDVNQSSVYFCISSALDWESIYSDLFINNGGNGSAGNGVLRAGDGGQRCVLLSACDGRGRHDRRRRAAQERLCGA